MTSSRRSRPRVIIVGAGPGGLAAASRLREAAPDAVDILVITHSGEARYLPGTLDVLLGRAAPVELSEAVDLEGVSCRAGEVEMASGNGAVVDHSGVPADAVLAAPGLALDRVGMDKQPGVLEAWDLATAARARTDTGLDGPFAVVVTALPYRCPPAPFSVAMAMAEARRAAGDRASEVVVATPELRPLAGVGEDAATFLERSCAQAGVRIEGGFELDVEASTDGALKAGDGRVLEYGSALVVPPHVRSPMLAHLPGDGPLVEAGPDGATAEPGLYVVGDAVAAPLPRAAGVAEAQGRTAADAVLARLELADPQPPHRPRPSCYLDHGGGQRSRIELSYPDGLPPEGEATVEIEGPTAALAAEADAAKRRFLDLAAGR